MTRDTRDLPLKRARIPLVLAWSALSLILTFPSLIPAAARNVVITGLTVAAAGVGIWIASATLLQKICLTVLAGTATLSWLLMPESAATLRHFSGIGAGILAAGVVSAWCSDRRSVPLVTTAMAAAAAGILTVGLIGSGVSGAKLVVGAPAMAPAQASSWLPQVQLGFPELAPASGLVNANALGGTAVMVLPLVLAIAIQGRKERPASRYAVWAGASACVVALSVLVAARSRTALVAAVAAGLVAAWQHRPVRRPIIVAFVSMLLATGAYTWNQQRKAADDFAEGVRFARQSLAARGAIWHHGVERLASSPWTGIGISGFHEAPVPDGPYSRELVTAQVSHAHNIFLQVALDLGMVGFAAYVILLASLLGSARAAVNTAHPLGPLVGGAALSLVAVHTFGLTDAVALGAKVGIFQWLATGLVLAGQGRGRPEPSDQASTTSGA